MVLRLRCRNKKDHFSKHKMLIADSKETGRGTSGFNAVLNWKYTFNPRCTCFLYLKIDLKKEIYF
jgi:hypothetical protein